MLVVCKHEATKVVNLGGVHKTLCVFSLGQSSSSGTFCLCGHVNIEKPFGRNVSLGME
jgi:hypothetical protein